MSKKANPAIIGGFVIGAIILTVVALLAFAGGRLFADTDTLVTYFEGSLRGLRVGANVTFRGVKIGEVTDVSVTTDARTLEFSIPVIITINNDKFVVVGGDDVENEDDLQDLIENGLRAQLNVQSMVTGLLEIELDFHPGSEAVYRNKLLTDYRELPTVPSTTQQLMARLRKLAEDFQQVDFQKLMANIADSAEGIDQLVSSPELQQSIAGFERLLNSDDTQALASSLRKTLSNIDATMASARELLDDTDQGLEPVVSELLAALEEVGNAATSAQQTLNSIREDLTGQSNTYFRIANALQEVENAARSFRILTEFLERHPEALIRGKPDP
ncbi:MAG: MlaD family protein [Chromatiales bacterium]|nr:MlaD family protein [Chromatiales bacterium]